ncbi:MAG: hypothetical protein ABJA34_12960 [Pseudonocardiales bacterium]
MSDVEVIRARIADSRGDDAVVDRLHEELWALPLVDVSRHRVLLATIGELRDGRSAGKLHEFVWYEGEFTPPQPSPDESRSCQFELDATEMLQARAVEMLAFLNTDEASTATLEVAARHPKRAVRLAAIDAYLFNHGDTADAAEKLHGLVPPEDRSAVGLPRRTRDTDPQDLERMMLAQLNADGHDRPELPTPGQSPGPVSRSWYQPGGHDVP